MSLVRTQIGLADWIVGAVEAFGDPAATVCQLVVRWADKLPPRFKPAGDDLWAREQAEERALTMGESFPLVRCAWVDDRLCLDIQPHIEPIPLVIEEAARTADDGTLDCFGAMKICDGVWALTPSLYMPGAFHAFVLIHDVPSPAPWECPHPASHISSTGSGVQVCGICKAQRLWRGGSFDHWQPAPEPEPSRIILPGG